MCCKFGVLRLGVSDMTNPAYCDAFNLLCGDKIGSGTTRDVFACRIRPDLVVKVEIDKDYRNFANVLESAFWSEYRETPQVKRWLAPIEYMSPDGRILLQKRVKPATKDDLPDKMPAFLCDFKMQNYGILDGYLVCVDYALTILHPSLKERAAHWFGIDD